MTLGTSGNSGDLACKSGAFGSNHGHVGVGVGNHCFIVYCTAHPSQPAAITVHLTIFLIDNLFFFSFFFVVFFGGLVFECSDFGFLNEITCVCDIFRSECLLGLKSRHWGFLREVFPHF